MRKDFANHEEAVSYYEGAERKIIADVRRLQKRLEDVRILKAYNQRMKEKKDTEGY